LAAPSTAGPPGPARAKDCKGRALTDEDIEHYQRIVVALNKTIRLMQEIDAVVEEHGGWPGAFASSAAAAEAKL
jgi:hypothetical protein